MRETPWWPDTMQTTFVDSPGIGRVQYIAFGHYELLP